jgi:hypothetical protein
LFDDVILNGLVRATRQLTHNGFGLCVGGLLKP